MKPHPLVQVRVWAFGRYVLYLDNLHLDQSHSLSARSCDKSIRLEAQSGLFLSGTRSPHDSDAWRTLLCPVLPTTEAEQAYFTAVFSLPITHASRHAFSPSSLPYGILVSHGCPVKPTSPSQYHLQLLNAQPTNRRRTINSV
jgi:hypothetical protein